MNDKNPAVIAEAHAGAVTEVSVVRLRSDSAEARQVSDLLAAEVPVALVYNGVSHAVMMASPLDLEDFALGFSLSEGIISEPQQIYGIDVVQDACANGIEVQIEIASGCFAELRHQRRQLAGRTGCGLCGKDSLQAFDLNLPQLPAAAQFSLSHSVLQKARAQMAGVQQLNALTGSLHAAAWVSLEGDILQLREDVGRHNALDKLLGCLAAQPTTERQPGWLLLSSRVSYELVQKAARAGIGTLAALSAPTALAVELAGQAGICLIGFLRLGGCVAYTGQERLSAE